MSVTWDELLEECSRIHTTRTRTVTLGNHTTLVREGSHKLSVRLPDGHKATVVPTRLHEPGFYVRAYSGEWGTPTVALNFRSPGSLRMFQEWVDAGEVDVLDQQE